MINLGLTLLSALLGALAFPNFINSNGYPLFAFLFLIPLFYVVLTSKLRYSWFLGALYGFVYYLIYNYWLKTFHPLAILIAPILESGQYLVVFMLLSLVAKLFKKRGYLALSLVYVAYLYVTQMGFLGYPYGNLTASCYEMLPLIQIVDIGGIWLLALILVLPQALVAEMLVNKSFKLYKVDVLLIILVYIITLSYGFIRLSYYQDKEGKENIRVAAVQHSADSWKGGYATYRRNFETLRDLSLEALAYNPDYILWSETAFVPSVVWHQNYPHNSFASELCDEFIEFGLSLPIPLITGNPEGVVADEVVGPFLEDGSFNWKVYNTVMLFGDGRVLGNYRKQHLVPFTEHFPYEKQLPRLYQLLLANDYNWWEKGVEALVFNYNGLKFSTPICFEDTFGYLSAEFVQKGADVLMNLTNDSWSGSVAAEMQHMQLATFRAIENRRPLIRGTNSGITCLVDITGKVINPLEPFSQSYGIYDITIGQETNLTFYTKHPDFFAKLILALALLSYPIGVWVTLKRKKDECYQKYDKLFSSLSDFYEV
ncbi:MAG: apolipoprotein N-acyltransferase [Spirochaetales bacterium]|nr:apolipoprotein N-acyltransferase [Spirochaetales bacterium]